MDGIYRVYLPWYVKLTDGSRYRIPLNVIMRGLRNNIFVVKVPQDEVDYAAEELISRGGFKPTIFAVYKGEMYSLAMKVEPPGKYILGFFPMAWLSPKLRLVGITCSISWGGRGLTWFMKSMIY